MTENKETSAEISIIEQLSKPLPKEAIQRTKGTQTKKGYDTTGYGYQYAVDRFNDVLGLDWDFTYQILDVTKGKYQDKEYQGKVVPGKPFVSITVNVSIFVLDKKGRPCAGWHTSNNYADALKGAITNGFKKSAAFWGVGRDAFAGIIDDDNRPLPDSDDNKEETKNQNGNMNTFDENYVKLSDEIKDGFKRAAWSEAKIKAKCLWANFDEQKLKAEIDKDLK